MSGVSIKDFWDLTPKDIMMATEAQQEKQQELIKTLAWLVYNGAALVSIGYNNPKKFPDIHTAFPSLFQEENEQQDWRVTKQRIEDFAKKKKNQSNV
ncbi:MAG: hypothetical protein WAX04_06600 [Oscillospiraceae bacterium]